LAFWGNISLTQKGLYSFVEKLSKFYQFVRVVLLQIHFGPGAARIRFRKYFFRIRGHSLLVIFRRRKAGRRYQATLHLSGRAEHGLTLDSGIYISKITPGSLAAR
jgi:hypothetical protein